MQKTSNNRKRRASQPCRCGVCHRCVVAEQLAEARFARHLDPYYYCGAMLNSKSPIRGM